jgi:hypothetical protein
LSFYSRLVQEWRIWYRESLQKTELEDQVQVTWYLQTKLKDRVQVSGIPGTCKSLCTLIHLQCDRDFESFPYIEGKSVVICCILTDRPTREREERVNYRSTTHIFQRKSGRWMPGVSKWTPRRGANPDPDSNPDPDLDPIPDPGPIAT